MSYERVRDQPHQLKAEAALIFPDPVLAVALLDRLLHHATTLNIRGESYRLRHRRQAGLTTPSPSA